MRVYIAGPEVFFANARDVIAEKHALAREYGFEPSAMEGETWPADKFARGVAISAANEAAIRAADFIIANLSPYRGASADTGTVYELGFMCALGRPGFAYTNDPRDYDRRIIDDHYRSEVKADDGGKLRGPDGLMIEDHGMVDNLMLDGGIATLGGAVLRPEGGRPLPQDDLSVYTRTLAHARRYFDERGAGRGD
ncbi:nucleoside 2-deoxyribosyltransferase [Consotaella aegiceratis]|uniref:nucleoside 2-deoxyribosyltransferase n=1 Tax=Consotaella aegiceratis TaxID=3097961 RepID=UPI002F3EAC4B